MSNDLGLKLHRSLRVYTENYHGVDDGAERTETSETHTRYVTASAEWYLSRTANFSYNCVQSSNEIEVNDTALLLLLLLLRISGWIFLLLWWWRRKTSHNPLFPFSVSAWCDNTGIRLLRRNTFRVHDFNAFKFLSFQDL